MSKSYKREAKAQARAVQQRRAERRSKHDKFFESPDSKPELPQYGKPFHIVKRWT